MPTKTANNNRDEPIAATCQLQSCRSLNDELRKLCAFIHSLVLRYHHFSFSENESPQTRHQVSALDKSFRFESLKIRRDFAVDNIIKSVTFEPALSTRQWPPSATIRVVNLADRSLVLSTETGVLLKCFIHIVRLHVTSLYLP